MNTLSTVQYALLSLIALLTLIGGVYLQGLGASGKEVEVVHQTLRQYASEATVALHLQNNNEDTLRVASAYVESHRDTERIDLGACTVYALAPGEAKECKTVVDRAASYRVAGIEGYRRRDLSLRKVDIPLN